MMLEREIIKRMKCSFLVYIIIMSYIFSSFYLVSNLMKILVARIIFVIFYPQRCKLSISVMNFIHNVQFVPLSNNPEYRRQYSYSCRASSRRCMHITMKIHVYNSPCITPVIQYLEVWNTAFNNNSQMYFEFKLSMKGKMIFINIRLSIHIDFQFSTIIIINYCLINMSVTYNNIFILLYHYKKCAWISYIFIIKYILYIVNN